MPVSFLSRLVLVLASLVVAATAVALAEDPPEEAPSASERVAALHSETLARLPEIDREIEAAIARAQAACEEPWAGARLNRAVDPYSLALHQEGRSRRDEAVSAMRSTQKGVAYFRLLNAKLLESWESADERLRATRARLVDAMRELDQIAEETADAEIGRRTRDRIAALLGEMWSTLRAFEGTADEGLDQIAEHREEWNELASQAREADPEGLGLQPRTHEKGRLMLAEFAAMDERFEALAGSAERHFRLLRETLAPLVEEVETMRKDYKQPRR